MFWILFGIAAIAATLLVARCIGAMGAEDDADHDVLRRHCAKEDGHEWD